MEALAYEILSHTADTGIEAQAPSLEELIAVLAFGMFDLMFDASVVPPQAFIEIVVGAEDEESLLVDVLSELLYRAETEDLLFCDFSVHIDEAGAVHLAAGGVPTAQIELTGPPIKAVSYHELLVRRTEGRWRGRVIFDV